MINFEGRETGRGKDVEVVRQLCPQKRRLGGDESSQKASQLLGGPFRLPISLRVVARPETGRGPNQTAEDLPETSGESGSPIRNVSSG